MKNISNLVLRYILARYKEKTTLIIGILFLVTYFTGDVFGLNIPDLFKLLTGIGLIATPTSKEIFVEDK